MNKKLLNTPKANKQTNRFMLIEMFIPHIFSVLFKAIKIEVAVNRNNSKLDEYENMK